MGSNSGLTVPEDDAARQLRLYLESFHRTGFDYIFAPSPSALPGTSHPTTKSAPPVPTKQPEKLSPNDSFNPPPNLAIPKHSQSCELHTSGNSDATVPRPTSSPDARHDYRLHFLGLPIEISEIIYRFLFQGSDLYVSKDAIARMDPANKFSVYGMLRNVDISMLNTCKFIREEAIPILNTQIRLIIFDGFGRRDPLATLPCDLLQVVSTISLGIDAIVHIKRERLPSLKRVRLVGMNKVPHTFVEAVDMVVSSPMYIVPAVLWRVSDWRWKFKQFARLAQEESFEIDALLMMVIGRHGEPHVAEALIIIKLDIMARRCVAWKGVIGDKEVPIIDKQQAEVDWATYGRLEECAV